MQIEIKIPEVGESVKEAVIDQWYKSDGDTVHKDEPLFVIETDKITLEIVAEADGILHIQVPEGETVTIGAVVGTIDTVAVPEAASEPEPAAEAEAPAPPPVAPYPAVTPEPPPDAAIPSKKAPILSPSVRRLVAEKNIDVSRIAGTGPGGRITKFDVLLYLEALKPGRPAPAPAPSLPPESPAEPVEEIVNRKPMTPFRRRIAARLLEARQNTAMLTTFNEIDMSRVMALRSQYQERFQKRHDVRLGMMSFFIKASVEALKEFPEINAFIDGDDIVYHSYHHIGVAVGSEKGLVVPVIRHADRLSFAQVEKTILEYVAKINTNRLELADLEGGTFTISNGGIYGSLLSTPILNTPQSGILGMHKIEKRPIAINDKIGIRPMMYVALSYDHRIVDGREAVTFLKRIKEYVENPERIMLEI